MEPLATSDEVVDFWQAAGSERWFTPDPGFDETCTRRFLATHEAAARAELGAWELTPRGALAMVLLLDQMPRNMFRGTKRVYATDAMALVVAQRAVERAFDEAVDPALRGFFYLPFMHSEALADQERCVALHERAGLEDALAWARHHRDIIARFGRFPHRNAILGRATTKAEQEFLDEGGFRG